MLFMKWIMSLRLKQNIWKSDNPDILDKTDWYQPVSLITSEEFPGKYFLQAEENAQAGDYTFLFCSGYFLEELNTVADVKALKHTVKAERRIIFYDEDLDEEIPNPPGGEQTPEPPGVGEETPEPPGGGNAESATRGRAAQS